MLLSNLTEIAQSLAETLKVWMASTAMAIVISSLVGCGLFYGWLENPRTTQLHGLIKFFCRLIANFPLLILLLMLTAVQSSPAWPTLILGIPYLMWEWIKMTEQYEREHWFLFKDYGAHFFQFMTQVFWVEHRSVLIKKWVYFSFYSFQICILTEAFTSHGLGRLLVLKAYPHFDPNFLLVSAVLVSGIGILIKLSYDIWVCYFKRKSAAV